MTIRYKSIFVDILKHSFRIFFMKNVDKNKTILLILFEQIVCIISREITPYEKKLAPGSRDTVFCLALCCKCDSKIIFR